MLELLQQVRRKAKTSRIMRFFGFKTTMGMDAFPNSMFSLGHLFEPSGEAYSSVALTGPALVQGVLIPQEISD